MLETIQARILERLRPGIRYARADLMLEDEGEVSVALWKQAMAGLVEAGKVTRTGQKRGTRYHLSGYPVTDEPPPPLPPPPPAPKPIPTPGIVMRRSATADLLSDADLGLRRRPAPEAPPLIMRRAQEPPPIHGTGLRPLSASVPSPTLPAPAAPPPAAPSASPRVVISAPAASSNPLRSVLTASAQPAPAPLAAPAAPPPVQAPPPPPTPPEPARAASAPARSTTSQSGPVRTVYHHFPSALQSAEPKRDQPSPPLRSVFHNPAMIARELHGPRKNRAAQAAAAEAQARAAAAEAQARAADPNASGAEGGPAPAPAPAPRSDMPIVPPQVQPILAALGISPNELRGSHGQPYGLRAISGAMPLHRPSLPPAPPAPPPPPQIPPLIDEARRVFDAMEEGAHYTRGDLIQRAEVNVAEWNKAIKQLLDLELVCREGERRASAYRRLPLPTPTPEDTRRLVWRAPTFWRPPGLIRRAMLQQQRQAEGEAPKARRERQAELDAPTLATQLGLPPNARLIPMLAQPELPDLFWRALVALANTDGGYIVLGVKPRWSGSLIVRGLNDPEATRAQLITLLRHNPKQLSRYSLPTGHLRIVNHAQRDLLLVEVAPASPDQLPAYLGTNAYTPHPDRGAFVFDDNGLIRKCTDAEVSDLWARWVHPLALDFPTLPEDEERSEYKHTIQRLNKLGLLNRADDADDIDDTFDANSFDTDSVRRDDAPAPPPKRARAPKASAAPAAPTPPAAPPASPASAAGDPALDPTLLAIAAPARERAKLPSEMMRAIIVSLCRQRPLTEQDITALIARSSATLQRHLLPLLDDGLIAFDLASQGYRATPLV